MTDRETLLAATESTADPRLGSRGTADRGASCRLEASRGWAAVERLREDWQWLHRVQDRPLPCTSWEAAHALRGLTGNRLEPLIVTLRGRARAEGLLALEVHHWPGGIVLRPLGAGCFGRHEPLLANAGLRTHPARLFRGLARRLGRSVLLDLPAMRADGAGSAWLESSLAHAPGWAAERGRRETEIRLAGGWLEVRASLPRSLLSRLASLRAATAAEQPRLIWSGPDRGAGPSTGGGLRTVGGRDPVPAPLLLRMLQDCPPGDRRLRWALLATGERLLAAAVVWTLGRQAVEMTMRVNPAFASKQPAHLLRLLLARDLAREGSTDSLLLPTAAGREFGARPAYQTCYWGAPFASPARLLTVMGALGRAGRRLVPPGVRRLLPRATEYDPSSARPDGPGPALPADPLGDGQGRLLGSQERSETREPSHTNRDRHPAGTAG